MFSLMLLSVNDDLMDELVTQLDSVTSKVLRLFIFMDVAIFDYYFGHSMVTGKNTGLSLVASSYRQCSRRCCVNGKFRDSKTAGC